MRKTKTRWRSWSQTTGDFRITKGSTHSSHQSRAQSYSLSSAKARSISLVSTLFSQSIAESHKRSQPLLPKVREEKPEQILVAHSMKQIFHELETKMIDNGGDSPGEGVAVTQEDLERKRRVMKVIENERRRYQPPSAQKRFDFCKLNFE